jgi:hypothetical protein
MHRGLPHGGHFKALVSMWAGQGQLWSLPLHEPPLYCKLPLSPEDLCTARSPSSTSWAGSLEYAATPSQMLHVGVHLPKNLKTVSTGNPLPSFPLII